MSIFNSVSSIQSRNLTSKIRNICKACVYVRTECIHCIKLLINAFLQIMFFFIKNFPIQVLFVFTIYCIHFVFTIFVFNIYIYILLILSAKIFGNFKKCEQKIINCILRNYVKITKMSKFTKIFII